MSDYQARITETADGSFYAMVVRVDDDDVITGINVRGVNRLVLAAQATSDFRGQTAEHFASSVNDEPVALDAFRLCSKGFHHAKPNLIHTQSSDEPRFFVGQ